MAERLDPGSERRRKIARFAGAVIGGLIVLTVGAAVADKLAGELGQKLAVAGHEPPIPPPKG